MKPENNYPKENFIVGGKKSVPYLKQYFEKKAKPYPTKEYVNIPKEVELAIDNFQERYNHLPKYFKEMYNDNKGGGFGPETSLIVAENSFKIANLMDDSQIDKFEKLDKDQQKKIISNLPNDLSGAIVNVIYREAERYIEIQKEENTRKNIEPKKVLTKSEVETNRYLSKDEKYNGNIETIKKHTQEKIHSN